MKSPFARAVPESNGGMAFHPHAINPEFVAHMTEVVKPYMGELNLNLGCGNNPMPMFVNIDRTSGPGTDVVADLERAELPYESKTVNCVLASHVLEHITHLIELMREIHRVLKPEGYLVAITPHAGSNDAWEDPTHVRAFAENSWIYWDREMYARQTGHGAYRSPIDFRMALRSVTLIPSKQCWDLLDRMKLFGAERQAMFSAMVAKERNAVGEMVAVLQRIGE